MNLKKNELSNKKGDAMRMHKVQGCVISGANILWITTLLVRTCEL
jgi:hypothetical protein